MKYFCENISQLKFVNYFCKQDFTKDVLEDPLHASVSAGTRF